MYHSFLIHSSADGHLGCFHEDTSSFADQYNLMRSIYYREQLCTSEEKKKENWVTDSNSLVALDKIM